MTVLDDSEFEREEMFSLILSIEGGDIRGTSNNQRGSTTSVFIQDDDSKYNYGNLYLSAVWHGCYSLAARPSFNKCVF